MASNSRTKAVKILEKYIWTLASKCDGIAEINKGLITDYCRFSVMASEMSFLLQMKLDELTDEQFDSTMKKYEKFNKTALNLYKVLKFEQIKDELSDFGNPYTKLFKEAEESGDF